MKQLTVKELRELLSKVKNQNASVAFYDSKRGKLLPMVAINESVDGSVVTTGFYDGEETAPDKKAEQDEAVARRENYQPKSDEVNPEFLFQGTHTVLLVRCVSEFDLKKMARKELANRGLNLKGTWVGFKKAKEVLGV